MITMNQAFLNALLADASYVGSLETANFNKELESRLTQPLADFITSNYEIVNQSPENYHFIQ